MAISQAVEDILEGVQLQGSKAFLSKLVGLGLVSENEPSWMVTTDAAMLTNSLVSSSRDGGAGLSSECTWPMAAETRFAPGHREGTDVQGDSFWWTSTSEASC